MKIPMTDKFLFELYGFFEKLNKNYKFTTPLTIKEAIFPDIYRLRREWEQKRDRKNFSRLIYRLKKNGFIKIDNLKNRKAVILTPKGEIKALKTKYKLLDKKQRKDRKWQMLIFDIPENKRFLRDLLREYLYFLGYRMLQRSIWVCPYDVFKETEYFLRKYSLDSFVRLFLIEELEI
jgi:hypothetical protein